MIKIENFTTVVLTIPGGQYFVYSTKEWNIAKSIVNIGIGCGDCFKYDWIILLMTTTNLAAEAAKIAIDAALQDARNK